MIQRRSHRTAPRTRSLALGGALAALAVVGGGTVVAVGGPTDVDAGDIRLAQNATAQDEAGQSAPAQEMPLGVAVDLDLEPVVARAAGGTIPPGTTVQVTGLPDGLTQDGWVISGTPTRAGEYEVLVTVSNSGISQSQRVALTVTDGETATEGAATTTDGATTTTDAPDATTGADGAGEAVDESGATAQNDETTTSPSTTSPSTTADDETTTSPSTTSPSTTAHDETAPTLSAVPGDPTQAGSSEEGAGDGVMTDDDDESTSPDTCALGDGQLDGDSLAQLLPMVTGDDDSETSGLVMVILNTVVNLLPSVLGDSGSIGELGSAGEFLCTIPPSLLGGGSGEAGAGTGDTVTEGVEAGAGGLGGAPLALLGMLTNGVGRTGQ